MRRPTLQDVARLAGLSVSCASRALKERPDISPATRVRVAAAAAELGYRPDPMLSALSAYRQAQKPATFQGVLAFLTTHGTERAWLEGRETGDLLRGACRRADSLGYRMEYLNVGRSRRTQERAWKIIRSRGIRGALLRSYPTPPEEIALPREALPFVDLFSTPHLGSLPTVSSHHAQSMELTLRTLRDRGYRHPGLVLHKKLSEYLHHGWWMAFQAYASWFSRTSVYSHDGWPVDLPHLTGWANRCEADALIYCAAHPIFPALRKTRGFSPEKRGFVCMDLMDPDGSVAGVYQDRARGGEVAVEWLQGMLLTGQVGTPTRPNALLVPGTWVDGEGLRAHP